MTRRIQALILVAATILVFLPARAAQAESVHRILIAGDSITQGSSGDYTWRYRLWQKLQSTAPGQTEFVGPRTDLYDNVNSTFGSNNYAVPFSGNSHAAKWGDTYAAEVGAISGVVEQARPDVMVVLLGVNDLRYQTSPQQTVDNVAKFVASARAVRPNLKILIGNGTTEYDVWSSQYILRNETASYNQLLSNWIAAHTTGQAPIALVNTLSGWDPRTDTWDGTHPNPTGETKIAQRVSEALAGLGVGAASPSIAAETAWEVAGPAPNLAPSVEAAALTWDRTPSGATGMFIERRLVQTEPNFTRLPYAVSGDGWSAEGLVDGGTYDFRLVPSKGSTTGVPGPFRTATIGGLKVGDVPALDYGKSSSVNGVESALATYWAVASNATGYALSWRTMTDVGQPWHTLPYAVTQTQWNFSGIPSGTYAQFSITPTRGLVSGPTKYSGTLRMAGVAWVRAYAALGDSYSSGLGAEDDYSFYTAGGCYRSTRAWAWSLQPTAVAALLHVACAGNTYSDLASQVNQADAFFSKNPGRPRLITFTLGGNDIHFSDHIQNCALNGCSEDKPLIEAEIAKISPTVGADLAALARTHPFTDILIGGYPGVIEPDGNSLDAACLITSVEDRRLIRVEAITLDKMIASRAHDSGIWTLGSDGTALISAFDGHNACTALSGEWINSWAAGQGQRTEPNSFHPNKGGQAKYAQVFDDEYRRSAQ